jgi:hypothetical protein
MKQRSADLEPLGGVDEHDLGLLVQVAEQPGQQLSLRPAPIGRLEHQLARVGVLGLDPRHRTPVRFFIESLTRWRAARGKRRPESTKLSTVDVTTTQDA